MRHLNNPLALFRLFTVCLLSVAVALPIAIISIAKLLIFLSTLITIGAHWVTRKNLCFEPKKWSVSYAVFFVLLVFTLSIFWSTGDTEEISVAFVKHGKLILIPVLIYLIRSKQEALTALYFFVSGQLFLLTSTWFKFVGVSIPWSTSNEIGLSHAVFSSYLDQSIMTAVFAAVLWHIGSYLPSRVGRVSARIICALALVSVFFIFQGRTGFVVAIALVSLTLSWTIPLKFRWIAVTIPIAMILILSLNSSKVSNGLLEIRSGIETFKKAGDTASSSTGIRLHLWRRSIQSVASGPWIGTGMGSWSHEFNRQERLSSHQNSVQSQQRKGNPHQEYLLWSVELGLVGLGLCITLLVSIYADSLLLETSAQRALQLVACGLMVSCLFNCSLYDALIGDFFCVLIGLLLAMGTKTTHTLATPEATSIAS